MRQFTFGFAGLGLIGGSIARALRQAFPDCVITAYDRNPDTLRLSQEEGIADRTLSRIDEGFSSCDILFLCAPVSCNDENLPLIRRFLSSDAILTDVGSVKTGIHRRIRELQLEDRFIGGHPMAGSERTGYASSKASLLENAYYILTPSPGVAADKVDRFKHLVEKIGAIPLILSQQRHDEVTAAVSHLPHVVASSLVNLVREADSEDGIMKLIAAGGFKDITRIASSSPDMWQQICLTNTDNISRLLSSYIGSLCHFKELLDSRDGDALRSFFDQARQYRDSFIDASSGPIKKSYLLSVDIADRPGALAPIAAILAQNAISIKNIGISHNREVEEGTLRIEFHNESDVEKAREILCSHGYLIHEKK